MALSFRWEDFVDFKKSYRADFSPSWIGIRVGPCRSNHRLLPLTGNPPLFVYFLLGSSWRDAKPAYRASGRRQGRTASRRGAGVPFAEGKLGRAGGDSVFRWGANSPANTRSRFWGATVSRDGTCRDLAYIENVCPAPGRAQLNYSRELILSAATWSKNRLGSKQSPVGTISRGLFAAGKLRGCRLVPLC